MTPTTIESIGIIFLTALATAFFITVFVGLAKDGRETRRRRRNEQRITEEAFAIIAALCAYDQIRGAEDKSDENKKEVSDEEDKAV